MNDYIKIYNIKLGDYYGKDRELGLLQEECAELIQAISKYKRAFDHLNENFDNTVKNAEEAMIDEIADVEILIDRVKYLCNIDDEDIENIMIKKCKRTIKRLAIKEESAELVKYLRKIMSKLAANKNKEKDKNIINNIMKDII